MTYGPATNAYYRREADEDARRIVRNRKRCPAAYAAEQLAYAALDTRGLPAEARDYLEPLAWELADMVRRGTELSVSAAEDLTAYIMAATAGLE